MKYMLCIATLVAILFYVGYTPANGAMTDTAASLSSSKHSQIDQSNIYKQTWVSIDNGPYEISDVNVDIEFSN